MNQNHSQIKEEIKCEAITFNQSFECCSVCGKSEEIKPAIPGLLHRTIICVDCQWRLSNGQPC